MPSTLTRLELAIVAIEPNSKTPPCVLKTSSISKVKLNSSGTFVDLSKTLWANDVPIVISFESLVSQRLKNIFFSSTSPLLTGSSLFRFIG